MNRLALATCGLLLTACAGCTQPESGKVQGYVEGEYVYISSPRAGRLEALSVQRGARAYSGQALFALEAAPEDSLRDEAARKLELARANLADASLSGFAEEAR